MLMTQSYRHSFLPHQHVIGVIGSRAKKAAVFRKLVEEYDVTEQELERIVSPVGLEIKAETPAEIAISITGQMIEVRADRKAAAK